MDLRAAVKAIRDKQYAPVYVLFGEENFLKEEFIAFARSEMIEKDYADFNLSEYDCQEQALPDILQDAETFPFMAERRLVVADNAYFLSGAKPTGTIKHEADPQVLAQYLDNPPPFSTIMFTVNADKLDERKKIVKTLQQKAVMISFAPLKDQELYAWIERRAKKYKTFIEREDAAKLVARCGSELRLLDRELEKLALYVGPEAPITEQAIELLASRTLEHDVFALVEAVVSGKLAEAFRILYDHMKTGEEPIKLMALFARQIRLLLSVKMWAPRGYSQQQLAGMLKVHPFAVKKAIEQARHFDEGALRKLLSICAEEDFRMKTGQVDKQLAVELFITKVAQLKQNPLRT
ncbi:UNVERIFIED_CONTAM: DNA polymerase-3 subunit delta [Brevibacillus sp. OAP136]